MSKVKFEKGLHFWLKGREYVIIKRLIGDEFQICDIVCEQFSSISEKTLIQLFFKDELEFEQSGNTTSITRKKSYHAADFTQIDSDLKSKAYIREKYVLAVLKQIPGQRSKEVLLQSIEQVSQEINDANPPSHITLYRWVRDYDNSGKDIRSLIPNYKARGNRKPKLVPEVHKIIESAIKLIYLNPARATVDAVYDEVIFQIYKENKQRSEIGLEQLQIPHRSSIYRIILKLDVVDKAVARYGKRTALKMYAPVQQPTLCTRPLERVEIDHTKLPFFVVDNETRLPIGVPSLTSAVDKYSGMVVGYYLSFEPFSSLSVMQCLLNAIRPKDYVQSRFKSVKNNWSAYGLMETLVVDNGKEFYSYHFQDACQQLQIHIQYTPPKMPWYKAGVERYFGMLNTKLLAGQPGNFLSTFCCSYDYDPKKNDVVSFSALQEMIHLFIIDIHNQDSHPEFKCPRSEVWSKAITAYPVALPPSNKELRVLLGLIEKRIISRRGVEYEGLYYNSPELVRLRSYYEKEDKRKNSIIGTSVKATIKIDPLDLSNIYIFDPKEDNFITIPSIAVDYTKSLTLWQHKVIKKFAAAEYQKVDIVALALAKKKIQEIVEHEWQLTSGNRTRVNMARWKGVGKEEFNTGYFESSSNVSKSEHDLISNSNDVSNLNSEPNSLNVITGVSDLGSAFISEDYKAVTDDSNKDLDITQITASPQNQVKSKSKRNKKAHHPVSDKNSDETTKDTSWSPDLSGWDVSIGLPS